jgi:hypothetical protein
MKTIVLIFVSFFITTANAAIYKCTDADGKIEFSDKPCMDASSVPMRLIYDTSGDPEVGALQNQVAMGQVTVGMTASQVRQAWGDPDGITASREVDIAREEWSYQRYGQAQKVILVSGKVVEVSNQPSSRASSDAARNTTGAAPMTAPRAKDANERRFIGRGMTSVEIHSRIGEPDSRTRLSCRTETIYNTVGWTGEVFPGMQTTREVCEDCWVYNPAAGDPQIETTVCFMNEQVSSITRRVVR